MLGWLFLWSFLDRLVGLGHPTPSGEAWIDGRSPTAQVLWFELRGPFEGFYLSLTGAARTLGPSSFERHTTITSLVEPHAWVDWVSMLSILLIGLALLLGVMTRIAAIGGIVWMVILYTATAVWPDRNPVVDEHVVGLVVLLGIAITGAGRHLGLGRAWRRVGAVARHPILE